MLYTPGIKAISTLVQEKMRAYHGLTGGILLLRNFSDAISVSPHVC